MQPAFRMAATGLLALLLQACAGGPAQGPSALQAMQRLPPMVGAFQRIPLTTTLGRPEDAGQMAITGYRQIAGTSFATITVPNAPDPRAAGGFGGPGMAQAMEQALTVARIAAERDGGLLTVRNGLTASRNREPVLRCVLTEVTIPERPASAAPRLGPAPTPGRSLRTECVGHVVDRFVTFRGVSADTAPEVSSLVNLGIALVLVLRDPNAPVTTELREIPRPGGGTGPGPGVGTAPVPAPDAAPTPPGTRRGRGGYTL